MATVRSGGQTALLIIDFQAGVIQDIWQKSRIISKVQHLVHTARQQDVPVIWIQHSDPEMPSGSPAWQWLPEIGPEAEETVVSKQFNSSFEQTELENELAKRAVSHLVLAGALTNWCLRSTAYAALERGYDVTLVADAHSTNPTELESGRRIEAESIVSELNDTFTWLSYPGRSTQVINTEAVRFAEQSAS